MQLTFRSALLLCSVWTTSAWAEDGRMYPDAVQASSFLRSNWNKYLDNYHPNYVADDNPATAWVEGVPGLGIGETVTLPLTPNRGATAVHVQIRPGYQKSASLFKANASPKVVRVSVRGRAGVVSQGEFPLTRTMGWQEVVLPLEPSSAFDAVEIEVREAYPGSKYEDLCISDVVVLVKSPEPYRAVVETARHQALLKWIAGRQAQAAYFASLPKTYPYASTQFAMDKSTPHVTLNVPFAEAIDPAMRAELLALDALLARPQRYRPARKAPAPPLPDGLYIDTFRRLADLLIATEVTFFETTEEWVRLEKQHSAEDEEGWPIVLRQSAMHIDWADPAAGLPRAIAWRQHDTGDTRMAWVNDAKVMARYDSSGRIESVIVSDDGDGEVYAKRVLQLSLTYSEAGQLQAIEQQTLAHFASRRDEERFPTRTIDYWRALPETPSP